VAWSVLQSAGASSDTWASSIAIATYATANLSSGTKLLAYVTGVGTASSVKDAAGNSFTQIVALGLNGSTANGSTSVWAIDTPAGDVGTKPQIKATLTNASAAIVIQEVSGLAAGSTIAAMCDGTPVTSTGSFSADGSVACGAYSSSVAGEFLLAFEADSQNSSPSGSTTGTPTGSTTYTKDPHSQTANFIWDAVPAYGNSTGGAETASFGITGVSSATAWSTVLVAFKLAPPVVILVPQPGLPPGRRSPMAFRLPVIRAQEPQAPVVPPVIIPPAVTSQLTARGPSTGASGATYT
jgi:hypothetical protein